MVTTPTLIDRLKTLLAAHPEVTLAIVFGSVAQGTAGPHSDIDLAVLGDRPLTAPQKMALIGDVADLTGRAVDLVDLRSAGEPVLGQVLTHGQRLHGSNEAYAQLMRRHLFDSADFLPYVQRMLEERRQAWIGQ